MREQDKTEEVHTRRARSRRSLVLALPAGLLASVGAWFARGRLDTGPDYADLRKRVEELEAAVKVLKSDYDHRVQKAEIDAAVEDRLRSLSAKLGPGRVP